MTGNPICLISEKELKHCRHLLKETPDGKRQLNEIRNWYKSVKLRQVCKGCGKVPTEKTIGEFSFHHPKEIVKTASVSSMVGAGMEKDVIQKEMDKCIFLCKECYDKSEE